jgi:hypothetical protein
MVYESPGTSFTPKDALDKKTKKQRHHLYRDYMSGA